MSYLQTNRRLKQRAALLESGETKSADARVCRRAQFGRKFQSRKERQRVAWWMRAFSGSPSFVAVVQSTNLRHRHDGPHFRRLNRTWLRRVLPQRKMCSRSVIVIEIRIEGST